MRSPAVLAVAAAVVVLAPAAHAAAPRWHPCRDAAPGARCGLWPCRSTRTGSTAATLRIEFELYRRRDRDRPVARHDGRRRGRAGLLDHRQPQLLPRAPPAADGEARPAARRRARDRALRRARLPRAPPHGRRLRAPRGTLRRAARPARGPVRDARGRRRPRGGARRARIATIDLYGDSYGSYVGQAFAVRHGDRLRSLVLDAAYPLPGTDPAFGDLAEATGGACGWCASAARSAARIRSRRCSDWSTPSGGAR